MKVCCGIWLIPKAELQHFWEELDQTDHFFVDCGDEKGDCWSVDHWIDLEIVHLLDPISDVLSQ